MGLGGHWDLAMHMEKREYMSKESGVCNVPVCEDVGYLMVPVYTYLVSNLK